MVMVMLGFGMRESEWRMREERGERRGIEDLDGGGFGVDSKVLDMANAWLGWVGLVVEFDWWL